MRKTIAILFISVMSITGVEVSPYPDRDTYDRLYVYSLARWCSNDHHTSLMYADAVTRYSKKYNLQPKYIARQIFRESYFRNWITHPKSGARGSCQIVPFPEHDELFRNAEKYNPSIPVREQYYWIYPSIETMCSLMSNYNQQYKSYNVALIAYWCGRSSEELTGYLENKYNFHETEYYKYILIDGYIEKNIMGL